MHPISSERKNKEQKEKKRKEKRGEERGREAERFVITALQQ
jgi:hypothetical protein